MNIDRTRAKINARKSWSAPFRRMVYRGRLFDAASDPWNRIAWSRGTNRPLPKLTDHAPWLNAEAIAYRKAVGAETKDGFFWK